MEKKPNLIHYLVIATMEFKELHISLISSIALNEEWHEEFQKADLRTTNIPWHYSADNFYGDRLRWGTEEVARDISKSVIPILFPNGKDHSLYATLETPLELPEQIKNLTIHLDVLPERSGAFNNPNDATHHLRFVINNKTATYGTILRHMLDFVKTPLQGQYIVESSDQIVDSGARNLYDVLTLEKDGYDIEAEINGNTLGIMVTLY